MIDHLKSVADAGKFAAESKDNNLINKFYIADLCKIAGLCHDFGKATSYFQKYLNGEKCKDRNVNWKDLKNHPKLSAFFGLYLAGKYVNEHSLIFENTGEQLIYEFMPVLIYIIIKRHHGNLDNLVDILNELCAFNDPCNDMPEIFQKQMAALPEDEISAIIDKISKETLIKLDISEFENFIIPSNINKMGKALKKIYEKIKSTDLSSLFYYITEFMYSILIYADKEHAIFKENRVFAASNNIFNGNLVDKYYYKKGFDNPVTKMNILRYDYYKDVTSMADKIGFENKILSITMPTGMGKTYTAISFALKLKERLEKNNLSLYKNDDKNNCFGNDQKIKIIYCLPFISVIDQNYEVFEKLLNELEVERTSENLIKYHSFTDSSYIKTKRSDNPDINVEDNEEYSGTKAKFLLENWQSEFIFTTFVQFFETFFTNRNSTALRFQNIANSIVILDEIQSVPHHYWKAINYAIKKISEYFNVYFILLTATMPLIFDSQKSEIKEIANCNDHLNELKRIKINVLNLFDEQKNFKKTSIEGLSNYVEDILKNNEKQSLLIVLNTINSSQQLYDNIKSKIEIDDKLKEYNLYYLSTNIIPAHRLNRINKIKEELKKGCKVILISTQIVEAGVDIDFEYVIRDMGPLDSINQVGGRCNRNFINSKQGILELFYLYDNSRESRNIYSTLVYGSVLIDKTRDCLIEYARDGFIDETDFRNTAETYFKKLNDAISKTGVSDDIIKCIHNLDYSLVDSDGQPLFTLIKEAPYKQNVFINIDDKSDEILEKYNEILKMENFQEKREKMEVIRRDFLSYIISINKNKIRGYSDENELIIISKNEIAANYNVEKGYITTEETLIL